MKQWAAILLTLVMALTLTACSKEEGKAENGNLPQEPPAQGGEDAGEEEVTGEAEGLPTGDQGDRPLYIFVGGQLVGSWENGAWVSAVPLGESEHGTFVSAGDSEVRDYTVAEILARERYYTYSQGTEACLLQCELYTVSDGPGGFDWDLRDTAALLDDYAVYVPEEKWAKRTFALPTVLEGEVAKLLVPDYAFTFSFGGTLPDLVLSQPLEDTPFCAWETGSDNPYWETAETALRKLGIEEDFCLSVAMTGQVDGRVLAINSAYDEGGYLPEDAEQIFSLVLWVDADGEVETVYQRVEPYTGDVTAVFRIFIQGVADLNGDGAPEICLRDGRWEWGHYYVMARDEDGTWQRVLQANNGT